MKKLTKSDEAMVETLRKAKETMEAICQFIEEGRYTRMGLRAFLKDIMKKTPEELAGLIDRLVADARKNDLAGFHYCSLLEQGLDVNEEEAIFDFKAQLGYWAKEKREGK